MSHKTTAARETKRTVNVQELQQRHQELKDRVTLARDEALEARANKKSLEERERKLVQQLKEMGIDPDQLDVAIAKEKAIINQELDAITHELDNPTPKTSVSTSDLLVETAEQPPSLEETLQASIEDTSSSDQEADDFVASLTPEESLDDLLNVGSH